MLLLQAREKCLQLLHEALQSNYVARYRDDVEALKRAYEQSTIINAAIDAEVEIFRLSRLDTSYKMSIMRRVQEVKSLTARKQLHELLDPNRKRINGKQESDDEEDTTTRGVVGKRRSSSATSKPPSADAVDMKTICEDSELSDGETATSNHSNDKGVAELWEELQFKPSTSQVEPPPEAMTGFVSAASVLKVNVKTEIKSEVVNAGSSKHSDRVSQVDLFSLHNSASFPAVDVTMSSTDIPADATTGVVSPASDEVMQEDAEKLMDSRKKRVSFQLGSDADDAEVKVKKHKASHHHSDKGAVKKKSEAKQQVRDAKIEVMKEKSNLRNNIANFVVKTMTPYFTKGRFASKVRATCCTFNTRSSLAAVLISY